MTAVRMRTPSNVHTTPKRQKLTEPMEQIFRLASSFVVRYRDDGNRPRHTTDKTHSAKKRASRETSFATMPRQAPTAEGATRAAERAGDCVWVVGAASGQEMHPAAPPGEQSGDGRPRRWRLQFPPAPVDRHVGAFGRAAVFGGPSHLEVPSDVYLF